MYIFMCVCVCGCVSVMFLLFFCIVVCLSHSMYFLSCIKITVFKIYLFNVQMFFGDSRLKTQTAKTNHVTCESKQNIQTCEN